MKTALADDVLRVCKILNRHSVEYLVVGGTAVALHGYFRHSVDLTGKITDKPDLDFWYNPTYRNYFKLLNALEAFGQDVAAFREEQAPNPKKSFFKYEFEQFTLDMLPALKAPLAFDLAYKRREVGIFDETDIPFISYDDLMADKEANARPKDLLDIEQLKNRQATDGA